MGQDHPVTWCKLYDGDNINDNTGTPKSYSDGRTWVTSMGHFGASYTENGGNNNLDQDDRRRRPLGRGRGPQVRLLGHRLVVVHAHGRSSPTPTTRSASTSPRTARSTGRRSATRSRLTSTGYVKMHDPAKAGRQQDHGHLDPDARRPRQLRGRRPRHEPAARLRPVRPDQAQHLRLLLAAQPGLADAPATPRSSATTRSAASRSTPTAPRPSPDSERVILRVPKAKIAGSPSGFPGGPANNGPGHVGGAGLDFDSAGNLYLGVGDDVAPGAQGHNDYPPMDYRSAERWDARKTSQNTADLRGKVVRITPSLGDIPAGAEPGAGRDLHRPGGQPVPGRHGQDPSRDLRDGLPPAVHAAHRPEEPGHRRRRRVLPRQRHRPGRPRPGRHLRVEPDQPGRQPRLAVLRRRQLGRELDLPLELRDQRDDGPALRLLADRASRRTSARRRPARRAAEPTYDGLDTLPGPVVPATIWKKYGATNAPAFGDLAPAACSRVAGPIYRYAEGTAGQGAFPRYYDGSWLINNRGADNGFWKEVQHAQGQQPDAAGPGLAAVQRGRRRLARTPTAS